MVRKIIEMTQLVSPVATVIEAQFAHVFYSIDEEHTNGVLNIYPAAETGHVKYDRLLYSLPLAWKSPESNEEV
jgi:hypothetical protein